MEAVEIVALLVTPFVPFTDESAVLPLEIREFTSFEAGIVEVATVRDG